MKVKDIKVKQKNDNIKVLDKSLKTDRKGPSAFNAGLKADFIKSAKEKESEKETSKAANNSVDEIEAGLFETGIYAVDSLKVSASASTGTSGVNLKIKSETPDSRKAVFDNTENGRETEKADKKAVHNIKIETSARNIQSSEERD